MGIIELVFWNSFYWAASEDGHVHCHAILFHGHQWMDSILSYCTILALIQNVLSGNFFPLQFGALVKGKEVEHQKYYGQ